ncbi:MAG: SpoIIIAC/SpoIIIAD family protein [Oscillospiraceae bacterium]
MNIFSLTGLCLTAIFVCLLLRQYRPEYSLFISLGVGAVILLSVLSDLKPIIASINDFFGRTGLPRGYITILLKSLGICYITELGTDICKDAGESAIATKLEIAGKISVIAISMPLFGDIISIVVSLIQL